MDGASDNPASGDPLSALERALIDRYQHRLPLVARPFAAIADELGASEAEVLAALRRLARAGVLSRVGAVFEPNRAGASTLAALAVPAERLEQVAARISGRPEVNHAYEREHRFNLWFVVTAESREQVGEVLAEIEREADLPILDLPLEQAYRLDLGFPVSWP